MPLKVFSFEGITPLVHPGAYVHPSAVLIGDVIVSAHAYVGPCASLRGDCGRILIGEGASVQDCCVIHGFLEWDTEIEAYAAVGHGAIIHGGFVRRRALIGMNAVVNDKAEIGESAIVAANAFVKAGDRIAPRTLAAGIPARAVRELSEEEITWMHKTSRIYSELAARSLATMHETTALSEPEPARKRLSPRDLPPFGDIIKD